MITIPLGENAILVTADKNIGLIALTRKIADLTSEYRKRF